MSHSPAEIKKQVRTYLYVFGALLVLTLVTVRISYLHLQVLPAIVFALIVATIKGSLVACYFMHLIDEKKFIYGALLLTVVLFAVLLFLPVSQLLDVHTGIKY